jgi:type VI protein secretion system component VasK
MLAMGRIKFFVAHNLSLHDHRTAPFIVYIIVIAWLYVIIMIAVVSDSVLKGVVRFLFLGALPVGLWFWMTMRRRRRVNEVSEVSEADETRASDET